MLLSLVFVLAAAPVTFQSGVQTPPLIGNPGDAALRFANSRKAEFGLDPRTTLTVGRQLGTRFGGTVQLVQTLDGLEVFGGKLIVTFDEQQRVVRVSSSLKSFSNAVTTARFTGPQALALATREVDGAWLRTDGVPYGGYTRMAFSINGELHVGFLTFVPTLKNSENWHVAIDATDGSTLWVQNRARASNAAKVYPSSPKAPGVGVTATADVTLAHLPDAGFLRGEMVRALNCCPTENCNPDAGPLRAQGMAQTFQGTVNFDVAICDQRPRASNDPAVHASGDFVYAPIDPPNTVNPSIGNPADYDEFAEVHAYFHVSKAYDAVRALSRNPLSANGPFSPFTMRTTTPNGDLPAVWVNVSDADLNSAQPNAQGVYVSNTLSRTENAMFLARENMEFLLLPPQVLASDALVIYQGQTADFAYDGPVLWHEFGHGVIHSTSDWGTEVSFDNRSANNESSALNEGMADLFAVMTGHDPVVGAYVGPRIDPTMSAIRNVENTEKCPDVLWGESHQDSLHVTGAVWEARKQFLGTDDGATFDAALYAAIVSFPPDVNFEKAATIITSSVVQAFPNVADARMKLQTVLDARGVTHCSKVLDVTNNTTPRTYYGITGTSFAGVADGVGVPGPYQFKIRAPRGVKSVTVTGMMQSFGGNTMSRLDFLASADRPITFAKAGTQVQHDAQAHVLPTLAGSTFTGTVDIAVPCGGEVYFALTNVSRRDRTLFDVSFDFQEAASCPVVVPDAGMMEAPINLALAPETLGAPSQGCGCSAVEPFSLVVGALWLARRRVASKRA